MAGPRCCPLLPAVLAIASFIAAGCDGNHIVLRSTSDYFPLRAGNYWRYADTANGNIRIVEVLGDTVESGRGCMVVADDFEPTFWIKSGGRIEKLVVATTTRYGDVDTLEHAYRLYFLLPFVTGAAWSDTFADTVVAGTDTVAFRHTIDVAVAGIEPVAAFTDAYRLEVTETIIKNDSTDTTSRIEWFAPGVGLVQRARPGSLEILEEYRLK